MGITSIAKLAFRKRQKELERHFTQPLDLQNDVLKRLVGTATDTKYGREHIFSATRNYEDFRFNVPVNTYEELKDSIDIMRHEIGRAHV